MALVNLLGPLSLEATQLDVLAGVEAIRDRLPPALDGDGGLLVHVTNFGSGGLTDAQLRATPVDVVGPLTDAELRATPVPVSGTVDIGTIPEIEIKNDTGNPLPVSGIVNVANFPATQNVAVVSSVEVEVKNDAGNAIPISASALPLPAGAATEATLAGIKTGTDKIPASPSQEHVTAASPHAARLSDGTSFYKATTPADTQPISASALPLPAGAATEATLGAMAANVQDIENLLVLIDANTNSVEQLLSQMMRATTPSITRLTASATSQQALAANANRVGGTFVNDSTATAYVKFGTTASATSYTYRMRPGSTMELPLPCYPGRIDIIWTAANGAMQITEMTP